MGWPSRNDSQNDTTELPACQGQLIYHYLNQECRRLEGSTETDGIRACCFSCDPGIRKTLTLLLQLPIDTCETSVGHWQTAAGTISLMARGFSLTPTL